MQNEHNESPDLEILEVPDKSSEQLNTLKIESSPTRDFFNFVWDLLKTGIVVFIFAFVLRYFVIQPYIVDGESMMPNYLNNEYLLAEKISYMLSEPKRGDVVIFRYPKNPSVNYIKRIIGLPGETVTITDNTVSISNAQNPEGFVLHEEYIPSNVKTETPESDSLSRILSQNEFFVLGDNRPHSSDSREWGVLPRTNIAGRSWVSIAKLGTLSNKGIKPYLKVHERVQYSLNTLSLLFASNR